MIPVPAPLSPKQIRDIPLRPAACPRLWEKESNPQEMMRRACSVPRIHRWIYGFVRRARRHGKWAALVPVLFTLLHARWQACVCGW